MVLAHILLRRIRDHLLRHQRPEESGFTPGKSTIDRILALRVVVERRREFGRGLLAAYIDLKKAFDTVYRESLRAILIASLYTGTESTVKCGGGLLSFFPTKVQDFGDLLGEPVQSVRACGEDIKVTDSFTFLGSVVHNSGLSDQDVSRRIDLAAGVMNSLDKSIW
ncbi:uncharacterized protein [Penaeus vannamei]|uniref:uncharacterized protein n=1 Tax=Penaeus vannamei TaxID=6689 RepID=UPI00387F9163